MKFPKTPVVPVPWHRIHAGTTPGQDLRWRGITPTRIVPAQRLDSTRQHERVVRSRL